MQPIPPYMHTKEEALLRLMQEEHQRNLQEYDRALQEKKEQELIKFTQ